jgi:hypothetical protein
MDDTQELSHNVFLSEVSREEDRPPSELPTRRLLSGFRSGWLRWRQIGIEHIKQHFPRTICLFFPHG